MTLEPLKPLHEASRAADSLTSVHTEDLPVDSPSDAPDASTYVSNAALGAFRHSGWTGLRNRVWTIFGRIERDVFNAGLLRAPDGTLRRPEKVVTHSRVLAFQRCGQDAYVLESVTEPGKYKVSCSKCHDRFCVPCMRERANANQAKILAKIQGVQHRFLTLTLKTHEEPLQEQLNRLYASFRKLRQRVFWKQHVKGGIAFIEVKWSSRSDRWHPHLHVLTHGRYMPKKDLGREWYAVTGDSYVVDIQLVKDDKKASEYVAKYASKGYDSSATATSDRLTEAIYAFHGRRFVIVFGDWKGFSLSDYDADPGWRLIDNLASLLVRVSQGDTNASRIFAALMPEVSDELASHLRGPPPQAPPPVQAPNRIGCMKQLTMWTLAPTMTERFIACGA